MYYIYGISGPSLLIESTDSMIYTVKDIDGSSYNVILILLHCMPVPSMLVKEVVTH